MKKFTRIEQNTFNFKEAMTTWYQKIITPLKLKVICSISSNSDLEN